MMLLALMSNNATAVWTKIVDAKILLKVLIMDHYIVSILMSTPCVIQMT